MAHSWANLQKKRQSPIRCVLFTYCQLQLSGKRRLLPTEKQINLTFVALKVIQWIFHVPYFNVCLCRSFFVIFPTKISPALISMLMYSCLHLTSEYVTANYHYTGREIRARSEGQGARMKAAWTALRVGIRPKNGNRASWNRRSRSLFSFSVF